MYKSKIEPAFFSIPGLFFILWFIYRPFIRAVLSGFKIRKDIFFNLRLLPAEWIAVNDVGVWKHAVGAYFFKGVFMTLSSVAVTIVLSSLLAFALARYAFKLRNLALMTVTGGMILSPVVTLINPHMIDVYFSQVVTLSALLTPFATFSIRACFLRLPREIEDCAFMDGCSAFQVFYKMIIPESKRMIAVVAALVALVCWNAIMPGFIVY